MSHLDERVKYESVLHLDSEAMPGVRYTIRRISFALRGELVRQVRELSRKIEFHEAGDGVEEQIEASLLAGELEQLYLRWGLVEIRGLDIDGDAATPETLIERGPEALSREISAAIRKQIGLTEEERKN